MTPISFHAPLILEIGGGVTKAAALLHQLGLPARLSRTLSWSPQAFWIAFYAGCAR